MPSLAMYEISPPTDEQEFENMLMDYGRIVCGGIPSSRLGHRGQKQHGIDVLVTRPDGTYWCIQCKDYIQTTVTKNKIDEWVNNAEESPIPFSFFIIATASRRDAKLQEYVAVKSAERTQSGKWPFSIIFWEDVEHFIKLYPELIRMYYPMLYQGFKSVNNLVVNIQNEKQSECVAVRNGEINEDEVRIKSENLLRARFLDIVVQYRIPEMLRVDPFTGFSFDLVVAADCFDIVVQRLMDQAFGITASDRYMQIDDFRKAFDAFNSYLSMICQTAFDGNIVKFTSDFDNPHNHYGKVEELRRRAIGYLNEVENC